MAQVQDINEYREKAIKHIENLIDASGLQSYEVTDKMKEVSEKLPDSGDWVKKMVTWRDEIYNSDDAIYIDKFKNNMNDFIRAFMKEKHEKLMEDKQKEHQENINWWTEYYRKATESAKADNEWLRKYNAKEHDWQKDLTKKEAENQKILGKSKNWEEEFEEKCKNDYIADVEMDLINNNVTDEALSKRLGISDWRDKIRQASDWRKASSRKSDLWDLIRKLKNQYTCAKCGVTNEEFTVYKKGNKKYCSWDCKEADKEKKQNVNQADEKGTGATKSTTPKKYQFESFTVDDFFAWMKKMNVAEISFDSATNQVVIKLKDNKKLDIANSGLSIEQQQELTQRVKSSQEPITYSGVDNSFKRPGNSKNGNAGIIGAVIVVGAILAIVGISILVRGNRRKD